MAKKQVPIIFSPEENIYLNLSWQHVPYLWATMQVPASAPCDNSIVLDTSCYCGVPA